MLEESSSPIRQIASVDFNRLRNRLEIETSGGARHRYTLVGGGAVKDSIEAQM